MFELVLSCLVCTALCAEQGSPVAPGVSLVQLHARVQRGTVEEDEAKTAKVSAVTNGSGSKPFVAHVKRFVGHGMLHKKPSSFGFEGCTDPEAANYDSSARVDDGSCWFGTQAPDFEYSFSPEQRMHPDDARVMYQMGHIVGALFDKYDIKWWLTDGSLLGALRNNGIIPHDDDIDFNVLHPQLPLMKASKFRKDLQRNGLYLDDTKKHKDRIYIWNHTEFERLHGGANERGVRMKLDLWPLRYWGGTWQQLITTAHSFPGPLCHSATNSVTGVPWKYSCQLERRRFGLGFAWAPNYLTSERYLTTRYGAWKSQPECKGTLHDCHLIENMTHDMLYHAEPAGPLIELRSQALLQNSFNLGLAVVLPLIVGFTVS